MAVFSRSKVRLLLVVSLAVNVFAVGAMASHWAGTGWFTHDREEARDDNPRRMHSGVIVGLPSPRRLLEILNNDQRTLLTDSWRAQSPQIRNEFRAMFDARDHVADTLSKTNYQRQDLEAAFAALRARQMELAATSQDIMIDLADHLDAGGRDRLAAIMRPPKGPADDRGAPARKTP